MSKTTKLYFFLLGWWAISTLFWYWIMTNPQVGWPPGIESLERSFAIMAGPTIGVYISSCWEEWFGRKSHIERDI